MLQLTVALIKFCRVGFRQTYFAVESGFHFSTSSLKVKSTAWNLHIRHRLFVREGGKYVSMFHLHNGLT